MDQKADGAAAPLTTLKDKNATQQNDAQHHKQRRDSCFPLPDIVVLFCYSLISLFLFLPTLCIKHLFNFFPRPLEQGSVAFPQACWCFDLCKISD